MTFHSDVLNPSIFRFLLSGTACEQNTSNSFHGTSDKVEANGLIYPRNFSSMTLHAFSANASFMLTLEEKNKVKQQQQKQRKRKKNVVEKALVMD